jgi:hypothetical protein
MKTSILLRNVHNWQICVHEKFFGNLNIDFDTSTTEIREIFKKK